MVIISHYKEEKQRQRSRFRERVFPYEHVPQEPQIQTIVTPESDDEIWDEGFTMIDPRHHQLLPLSA